MNETSAGSLGVPDHGGRDRGSSGQSTPLQTRAHFLQNWNWLSVTQINSRLCQRGGAQQGSNQETHETIEGEWEQKRREALSLLETLDFLRSCHRGAPFLFFNGNTFAEIGRTLSNTIFSDLPYIRKKELSSAVAHFITGVLNRDLMVASVNSLCESASFQPGDPVQTLRGTTRGVIVRILDDGRVVWKPDNTDTELTGLPESLKRI
jgi:hypothetical protein